MVLYKSTMLYPIAAAFDWDMRRIKFKRVMCKFDVVADIADIKEPTFTYAHFFVPHAPCRAVPGRAGRPVYRAVA